MDEQPTTATVHDVAAHILARIGEPITTMKLQKLVYYSQAWSLVWDKRPLFNEPIAAWRDGPVVRSLWESNKAFLFTRTATGDPSKLTAAERATIDAVVDFYGKQEGEWLSALTHREAPWINAREGVPPQSRSAHEISHEVMRGYYGRFATGKEKRIPEALERGLRVLCALAEDEIGLLEEDDDVSAERAVAFLEGAAPSPWIGQG